MNHVLQASTECLARTSIGQSGSADGDRYNSQRLPFAWLGSRALDSDRRAAPSAAARGERLTQELRHRARRLQLRYWAGCQRPVNGWVARTRTLTVVAIATAAGTPVPPAIKCSPQRWNAAMKRSHCQVERETTRGCSTSAPSCCDFPAPGCRGSRDGSAGRRPNRSIRSRYAAVQSKDPRGGGDGGTRARDVKNPASAGGQPGGNAFCCSLSTILM